MTKFFCIFLLLFCYPALYAETCHSLSDVLALSLLNNPELNSFSYEVRASDARILQASLRPNPALDIETENLNAPHFVQTTFLLSQVIELGGKNKARVQYAKTERDRTLLEYEVAKRELFVNTTLLFIDVLVNQQKITFLEEYLKTLQECSCSMKRQVEAGRASVMEEANFNILLSTASIDLLSAQNDLMASKQRLAAQWGQTSCPAFGVVGDLTWIPSVACLEELGCLLENHPQIMLFNAESRFREARLAVERSRAVPDVAVRGGPRYLKEAEKWTWVVGVFIPIPLIDRNQGRISEASAYFEKLESEREALWVELMTELNNSYLTLQTYCSEVTLLKNSILPATQTAFESCHNGFELARYNYSELLETQRIYKTSKIRYFEALGEYHKALAQIEGLIGTKAICKDCE